MKNRIFVLALFSLILSCKKVEKNINSEEDVLEAKRIAESFYKKISNNDTLALYSNIYPTSDLNKFKEVFNINIDSSGKIYNFDLQKIETESIVKDHINSTKTYKIQAKVVYAKRINIETLGFIKYDNEPFKLFSYDFKVVSSPQK